MMRILLKRCDRIGLPVFIYLGGAGAYELLGGRKWRASLLIGGALLWVTA